jgi:hypothetical protein
MTDILLAVGIPSIGLALRAWKQSQLKDFWLYEET